MGRIFGVNIFSIPLSGGAFTKIVASVDTLPVIGQVTDLVPEFSVDNGSVVFIAENESARLQGIFLYSGGKITKIFASGDALDGSTLTFNGTLEIWPESYKNGILAFEWGGGVFVATPSSTVTAAPTISSGGIVPIYGTVSTIQPGSWVSIYGNNLITGTVPVSWSGNYPTTLGGTTVTIDSKPAYLSYAAPTLINLEAPDDTTRGTVNVTVTNSNGSATSTVTLANQGPAFSLLGDGKHVAAIILRPNGSGAFGSGAGSYDVVGPAGTSLGYTTVPAKAGDSVVIFGIGFGPTNPAVPAGQPFSGAAPATDAISLTINGKSVTPSFSGLSAPGLFQFNITVPSGLGTGDQPIQATVNAVSTQSNVVIALQ